MPVSPHPLPHTPFTQHLKFPLGRRSPSLTPLLSLTSSILFLSSLYWPLIGQYWQYRPLIGADCQKLARSLLSCPVITVISHLWLFSLRFYSDCHYTLDHQALWGCLLSWNSLEFMSSCIFSMSVFPESYLPPPSCTFNSFKSAPDLTWGVWGRGRRKLYQKVFSI